MVIFLRSLSARKYWVLFMLVCLTGCNVTADEKATPVSSDAPSYMKALVWAESADAEQDANRAIAKQDYRLYVVASRGENMPGIESSVSGELKQRCGTQYIQGSTDAIKGDQHMAALKKAYNYAAKYNQIIAKHCPN